MLHFALLKAKAAKTLQLLSKWFFKSNNWFIRVSRNCVDTSCSSFFSIHSSTKSNTGSSRQRHSLRAMKIWLSLLVTLVSTSNYFNFLCAVLCVANPSGSINKWLNQSSGIRIAQNDSLFNKVGRVSYRHWNVLANTSCGIDIAEFIFQHTEWLKIEDCHVVKEFLDIGVRVSERV